MPTNLVASVIEQAVEESQLNEVSEEELESEEINSEDEELVSENEQINSFEEEVIPTSGAPQIKKNFTDEYGVTFETITSNQAILRSVKAGAVIPSDYDFNFAIDPSSGSAYQIIGINGENIFNGVNVENFEFRYLTYIEGKNIFNNSTFTNVTFPVLRSLGGKVIENNGSVPQVNQISEEIFNKSFFKNVKFVDLEYFSSLNSYSNKGMFEKAIFEDVSFHNVNHGTSRYMGFFYNIPVFKGAQFKGVDFFNTLEIASEVYNVSNIPNNADASIFEGAVFERVTFPKLFGVRGADINSSPANAFFGAKFLDNVTTFPGMSILSGDAFNGAEFKTLKIPYLSRIELLNGFSNANINEIYLPSRIPSIDRNSFKNVTPVDRTLYVPTTSDKQKYLKDSQDGSTSDGKWFGFNVVSEDEIITATVNFESNGGTPVDKETVNLGNKISEPAKPTKSGYEFVGWYEDNNTFLDEWNFGLDATYKPNMTLYAKWNVNKYNVTYNSNGGTEVDPESVESVGLNEVNSLTDDKLIALAQAKAFNYETNQTVEIKKVVNGIKPAIGTHNVTFVTENGTRVTVKATVYEGSEVNPDPNIKERIVANNFSIGINEVGSLTDDKLIALAQAKAFNYETNQPVEITNVEGIIKSTKGTYDVTFVTANDTRVTVKATVLDTSGVNQNPNIKEKIVANNFEIGSKEVEVNVASISDDKLIALAQANAFNYETGVSVEITNVEGIIKSTKGTYDVTFVTANDTRVTVKATVYDESEFDPLTNERISANNFEIYLSDVSSLNTDKLILLADAKAYNYGLFGNVSVDVLDNNIVEEIGTYDVSYISENGIEVSTKATVLANPISKYAVSYESNGGTAVNSEIVALNGLVTKPTNPTKAGFSFAGWYKDPGLTDEWDFATDKMPANNIKLYAKWTVNRTDVAVKPEGGNNNTILSTGLAAFTLSGCTSMKEVDLVSKEQLIEKQFETINYDEKEAYISPDNSYVAVIEEDKIVEAFLTGKNVTMHNDESGIYVSNGGNFKLYSDKCFVDENELEIGSEECKNSEMGNNLNEFLKANMPDLLK
ncbi:hypothetical protein GJ496_006356 [Pomphorhynchus laevis]|nr:hypothetical protein GJ496_006356 [Pomphorhynchus laevis]